MKQELTKDDFSTIGKTDLLTQIQQLNFFHAIDLDGYCTAGGVSSKNSVPNYHLLPLFRYLSDLKLDSARCLDVETCDGLVAFVLSKSAATVHATSQKDVDRFRLVRAYLGIENLSYHPLSDVSDFKHIFKCASFHLVVLPSVLNHLTSPLDALLSVRRIVVNGGFLLVEAAITKEDGPGLTLSTQIDDPAGETPTFWLTSRKILREMLNLACFNIVSETFLLGGSQTGERLTILAQAVAPSHLSSDIPNIKKIHQTLKKVGDLDLADLEYPLDVIDSNIEYLGADKNRTYNIWLDRVDYPLQPKISHNVFISKTECKVARESDFLKLTRENPDDAFSIKDIHLIAAKYPGECLPEGMQWSLKQIGNLFVLSEVKKWGLKSILEIGAGFNFYFPNHLPEYIDYTNIDDSGFYEKELMEMVKAKLPRGRIVEGQLGKTSSALRNESFDGCISVSVLEHISMTNISAVCNDMARVLKPNGRAIHSIDVHLSKVSQYQRVWVESLRSAGFEIEKTEQWGENEPFNSVDPPFLENLAIKNRFYGGYNGTFWGQNHKPHGAGAVTVLLVSARKK